MDDTNRRSSEDASRLPVRGDDDVSIYAMLRVLLEHRYAIIGMAVGVALLMVAWAFLEARTYTARAAFMPQSSPVRGATGGLAALAGQFGVTIPDAEPAQSPQFYAELIISRELVGRLLQDTFVVATSPAGSGEAWRGSLSDLLEIEEENPPERRERTLRAVTDAISTRPTGETGVVRVLVTTPWAELSEAITRRLLELVNEFNLETRQTTAAAESRFIEARLLESEATLRAAEEDLRTFLEANRQFERSPELVFEHDRLQRRVTHQQELFTGLQQSLENARIAQVRDTPLITVIEQPESPVYPDSRPLVLRAILGFLLGGMIALGYSFAREFVRTSALHGDPEFRRFEEAWGDTLADIRNVGRPSGGRSGRPARPGD